MASGSICLASFVSGMMVRQAELLSDWKAVQTFQQAIILVHQYCTSRGGVN
jgi:hypothetical protein